MKKTKARYGRGGGEYRRAADSIPLSVFSPEAIQSWRIAYVRNRDGDNPAKQRAARITCNSLVRLARSLFSPGIRKFIPNLLLPAPIPFEGVAFYPRESMRYQSKIDPAILLKAAQGQLRKMARDTKRSRFWCWRSGQVFGEARLTAFVAAGGFKGRCYPHRGD